METLKAETLKADCNGCGASLSYAPGTMNLKCQYCGSSNAIEIQEQKIEETHFIKFLKEELDKEEKLEVALVKCSGCSAEVSLKPNVSADVCPFCGTGIVVTGGSTGKVLKPKYLLPFSIDRSKAEAEFRKWIKSLWFAPRNLKKYSQNIDRLNGMYIPHWTYDCATTTRYSGSRGDDYYETEYYTDTENGKSVTKSRKVKHTRWTNVSGTVGVKFDDLLVMASSSLPEKYARNLEPWDLKKLIPFDEKFLAGMRAETYQLGLEEGFGVARDMMDPAITGKIRSDIGGDHQRIHQKDTDYNNITFKYILLPVWLSSFRYKDKIYRFMINGRTGEVQGERPYSAVKITLFILMILSIIGAGVFLYMNYA